VAVEVDCTAVEPIAAPRWDAGTRAQRVGPALSAH